MTRNDFEVIKRLKKSELAAHRRELADLEEYVGVRTEGSKFFEALLMGFVVKDVNGFYGIVRGFDAEIAEQIALLNEELKVIFAVQQELDLFEGKNFVMAEGVVAGAPNFENDGRVEQKVQAAQVENLQQNVGAEEGRHESEFDINLMEEYFVSCQLGYINNESIALGQNNDSDFAYAIEKGYVFKNENGFYEITRYYNNNVENIAQNLNEYWANLMYVKNEIEQQKRAIVCR